VRNNNFGICIFSYSGVCVKDSILVYYFYLYSVGEEGGRGAEGGKFCSVFEIFPIIINVTQKAEN